MIQSVLLIPAKPDDERDSLAEAWVGLGGDVKRVDEFWIKPEVGNKKVAFYGNETFCLVLSQVLAKNLVTVKDDMIVELDKKWTKRALEVKTIEECLRITFPKFIKSVIPKAIPAKVYQTRDEFLSAIGQYDPSEKVIVSATMEIRGEVRVFVLDNTLVDLSFYEGDGNIADAERFAFDFLRNCNMQLPKTFVMDLGWNDTAEWFIIEFNSTWGAGLNGCDPGKVIGCVMEATIN